MSQRNWWKPGLVAALAAALAATACKGGEQAKTTPAGGAGTVSGEGTPSPANSTATARTTTGRNLTDPNIIALVDEANTAEIDLGNFAATKAKNAQVKDFARTMVAEHTGLREDERKLAQRLNLTPQPPPGDNMAGAARSAMDSLRNVPQGPAFDKAYIDHEVTEHQAVIDTVQTLIGQATTPQVKGMLENSVPVLQKHLTRAKAIQSTLGSR